MASTVPTKRTPASRSPAARFLRQLDYSEVASHYRARHTVQRRLVVLFNRANRSKAKQPAQEYADLALGISRDGLGNYSASKHDLGRSVLGRASPRAVVTLAWMLSGHSPQDLPKVVTGRCGLDFIKISVGSEIASMLRPKVHWVTNRRTVWTHLLMKYGDLGKANEMMRLGYGAGDEEEAEGQYAAWAEVHVRLGAELLQLARATAKEASRHLTKPGPIPFIWADTVASSLYEKRDELE